MIRPHLRRRHIAAPRPALVSHVVFRYFFVVTKIVTRALTSPSDALSASQEDYLEAIFEILLERPAVRARDIARRLRVSGASVTAALRHLAARKLISYAPYEYVTLTDAGRKAGSRIARRHAVLRDFFVEELGADPAEAEQCACRIEHVVTPALFERWVRYLQQRRRLRRPGRSGKRTA